MVYGAGTGGPVRADNLDGVAQPPWRSGDRRRTAYGGFVERYSARCAGQIFRAAFGIHARRPDRVFDRCIPPQPDRAGRTIDGMEPAALRVGARAGEADLGAG